MTKCLQQAVTGGRCRTGRIDLAVKCRPLDFLPFLKRVFDIKRKFMQHDKFSFILWY